MKNDSQIYTSFSMASHPLFLDEDGLLLLALLLGGDYHSGVSGCGSKTAHALARCGFGRDLREILANSSGGERDQLLTAWRHSLMTELRTNSSGFLKGCRRKFGHSIMDNFPNLDVVQLYTDPLTSWSSRFAGTPPDTSLWTPREPFLNEISEFCAVHFGWHAELRDRLKSRLWPGAAFRLISSVSLPRFIPSYLLTYRQKHVMYEEATKLFKTQYTNAALVKIVRTNDKDLGPPSITLFRLRISTADFIQKARLPAVAGDDTGYVLVTVPESIFASATSRPRAQLTAVSYVPLFDTSIQLTES